MPDSVRSPASRAVVFDVGNVLYGWDIRSLYAKLIADSARLEWFCTHVVTPEWHFQHDAGRPHAETVAELSAQYPAEADLIAQYVPRWLETITGPVPGVIEIVDELAVRGVALFAITNFSAEFWPMFRVTAPVFDHFTDVLVSGAEKMVKPDAAIFQLALRRFGLAPGQGLFIDDRMENITAGKANGFPGHHFTGAARLRTRLVAEGLLPA
ncbi:HAD family phosphatase [Sandarakinorhabdus sp.]|uniref:HAD family hydrolase n=1 Tax=Sandarakinorhabdus sp. TaxID=1916663 RepID=UPI00286DF895|nr:HAD family phosphatase [Sandarakinorhabdus sp.]